MHFPECKDAAGFLHVVNAWWTISNSNAWFQCNVMLGNASVLNDSKPKLLGAFDDWLDSWQHQKIPNCERFTLSIQSNAAEHFHYTLQCPTNLIEILLHEQYQFVLTETLQSDPVERRLGQYRQESDGRFSISAMVYVREDIENHKYSERMIWHESISPSKLQSIVERLKMVCYKMKVFLVMLTQSL